MIHQCKFCLIKLKTQKGIDSHRCRDMKRMEYVSTVGGLKSYAYFKMWVKMKHSTAYDLDYFINSRFYNSFVEFSEFVPKRNIVAVDLYLKFMILKSLTPNIWCSDIVYEAFINYLDHSEPMNCVNISLKTLNKLSTNFDCDIDDVMYKMYPNEFIDLLNTRHLSPWLLLNTQGFVDFLDSGNLSEEQELIITGLISKDEWVNNFKSNPNLLVTIKGYVEKLKL